MEISPWLPQKMQTCIHSHQTSQKGRSENQANLFFIYILYMKKYLVSRNIYIFIKIFHRIRKKKIQNRCISLLCEINERIGLASCIISGSLL